MWAGKLEYELLLKIPTISGVPDLGIQKHLVALGRVRDGSVKLWSHSLLLA